MQSKRELFFKSDSVGGGATATGPPSSAPPAPPLAPAGSLKDALAKRAATLPAETENHIETNGTAKLTNSSSVESAKSQVMAPPSAPAPPLPTNPPASAPLRSTENLLKVTDAILSFGLKRLLNSRSLNFGGE